VVQGPRRRRLHHILKVGHEPGSPLEDLIDTEAACLALARPVGLGSVDASIETTGNLRVLVISRYDRIIAEDGAVTRLHQEDGAQALRLNTSDLNREFQRGKAIPSLAALAQVLREGGIEPDGLVRWATLNVAVGNTDGHAKNISVLHHRGGRYGLAPAYDVSMHAHHTTFEDSVGLDVNGKTRLSTITGADLVEEARAWPLPPRRARGEVETTLLQLRTAVDAWDHGQFPGVPRAAWKVVRASIERLLRSLSPG